MKIKLKVSGWFLMGADFSTPFHINLFTITVFKFLFIINPCYFPKKSKGEMISFPYFSLVSCNLNI